MLKLRFFFSVSVGMLMLSLLGCDSKTSYEEGANEQGNTAPTQTTIKANQTESGPWRDVYLTGAYELRHGSPKQGLSPLELKELLLATPVSNFLESMAVRLNGPEASGKKMNIKITFSDLDESYLLMLENSVLHHKKVPHSAEADTTLKLTKRLFVDLIVGAAGLKETLFGDDLSIEGSKIDLISFFSLLDKPKGTFNIVTP